MQNDLIIVGAGLAALTLALSLPRHIRICIIFKNTLEQTSSDRAQGGIAAAIAPQDRVDLHIYDTLIAGANLCEEKAVEEVLSDAPAAIAWLQAQQIPFTHEMRDGESLHLTREGGHSERRIVHVADYTGNAIMQTLRARLSSYNNIKIVLGTAIDLLLQTESKGNRCGGIKVLIDTSVHNIYAATTVLATGGMGQLYPLTSNALGATGDGVAMAWRAGCRLSNLEFIQFHPTCLSKKDARPALISEAVRGEGGVLLRNNGTRFMPDYDKREELAPRDIVARAILCEMQKQGEDHVWLDISHQPPEMVHSHFPTIYASCLEIGIDITKQPIPVAPAAHYACGGILANTSGVTDVEGLFAIGEVACTGLHGANRLASNSLLECVVMARRAAKSIGLDTKNTLANASRHSQTQSHIHRPKVYQIESINNSIIGEQSKQIGQLRLHLQQLMLSHAGIVRNTQSLILGVKKVSQLQSQFDGMQSFVTHEWIELRNMLLVASLLLQSALHRHESRGLHASTNWPQNDSIGIPSVLTPKS